MAKHKMVLQNLIKNSIAAFFAAIEIHNKPSIPYRYETVTLLILNAWELILKAYVWKNIKPSRIFREHRKTITLSKALVLVMEHINAQNPKCFTAIYENIVLINEYRDSVAHFYDDGLVPLIFSLVSRSAINYVEFMKIHFSKDIMAVENLFIMPLGFKLPFSPEDFLSKNSPEYSSSTETKKFIDQIITVIKNLEEKGIEESVVVGFGIYLESVKTMKNSDLLVAITSKDEATSTIAQVKNIRLSDDPCAQPINVSDDDYGDIWIYTYDSLCKWCNTNIEGFVINKLFHQIKKEMESNIMWVRVKWLDPKKEKGPKRKFYSAMGLEEIKRRYLSRK